MILSILDTDLYKFSTSNAYFQLYPLAEGTFKFNDRAKEVYDGAFLAALKEEIKALGRLALTEEEFEYVTRRIKYIPRNYWEWLTGFRFNPDLVEVRLDDEGHLQMEVTDYLYKVTLYEVPLLAIVAAQPDAGREGRYPDRPRHPRRQIGDSQCQCFAVQ